MFIDVFPWFVVRVAPDFSKNPKLFMQGGPRQGTASDTKSTLRTAVLLPGQKGVVDACEHAKPKGPLHDEEASGTGDWRCRPTPKAASPNLNGWQPLLT